MSKINLLSWREELKKVNNRIFSAILTGSVLFCIGLIYLVSMLLGYKIDVQVANQQYVEKELLSIKSEIGEIQGLQENKKQLLERMKIIGSLQIDRLTIVKLLDLLPRIVPDGIYLTNVSRKEQEIIATTQSEQSELKLSNMFSGKDSEKIIAAPLKKYSVTIQGVALTNGSISNILKNLEDIGWVSEIKLSEVSINQDNQGLNFTLQFIQNVSARE